MKTLIFLLIFCFSVSTMAQTKEAASSETQAAVQASSETKKDSPADGFRGFRWGTSRAEVVAKEGRPLESGDSDGQHVLMYSDRLFNQDVTVLFFFVENKLARGSYNFAGDRSLTSRQEVIKFFEIQDSIEKKYGDPTKTGHVVEREFNSTNMGTYVLLGYVKFKYFWEKDDCEIIVATNVEGAKIQTIIIYQNNTLLAPSLKIAEDNQRSKL